MENVKPRRRNLSADTNWLLRVAEGIDGQLVLSRHQMRGQRHKQLIRFQALLKHEGDGGTLRGIGNNPTEAVHGLRLAVERMVEMEKSKT